MPGTLTPGHPAPWPLEPPRPPITLVPTWEAAQTPKALKMTSTTRWEVRTLPPTTAASGEGSRMEPLGMTTRTGARQPWGGDTTPIGPGWPPKRILPHTCSTPSPPHLPAPGQQGLRPPPEGSRVPGPPHPRGLGSQSSSWVNRVPGPPQPRGLGSQDPLTPREALGWQLPPTAPALDSSGGSALLGRGMQGGSHSPGGLKAWGFQSPGSPTARGVPQP